MKKGIIILILMIFTRNSWGFDIADFEYLVYITKRLMDVPYKNYNKSPIDGFNRYKKYIYEASKKYSIDPFLIHTIILYESNYNPFALSSKGAKGLMQLMPQTAREMGVKDIFNPRENILAGTRYFRILLNRYNGNYYKALIAYNAGPEAINNKRIPLESRIYAKRILNKWRQFRRYKRR